MHLAEEIVKYHSVAIAGLAKNAGKTVTLNHLIREAHKRSFRIGVTSVGIDGESIDQVTLTGKPEIRIYDGMLFATSEVHYRKRLIESEVIGISPRQTSLGKVVTARALSSGKVLLSGPPDTFSLKRLVDDMLGQGIQTVLVDGALSRVSLASPAVTEALILATGAAVSPDIRKIVGKTHFVCSLTELPEVNNDLKNRLQPLTSDVWVIDDEGNPVSLGVRTSLDLKAIKEGIARYGSRLFVAGVVTDRLLQLLVSQKEIKETKLIVRDFTKLFVEAPTLRHFLNRGGEVWVLQQSRLIAVTINPWSPNGYSIDKNQLLDSLGEALNVPVIYLDPGDK